MKRILNVYFLKKLAISMGIFMLFSTVITFLSTILPEHYYYYKNWLYTERNWERNGLFYLDVFKVKKWRHNLPGPADFVKYVFSKKFIKGFQKELIS
jgi:glycosyl-4,4'-diaponeurosporenoate acyltransferase